jgi:Fe-S oxidoreductase
MTDLPTPPLLPGHERALGLCVYCPKLCRANCPVSNLHGSETLTPWGKMSLAYFLHRGDVPRDSTYGAPVWACTGCMACRERCEHDNDVAHTLLAARAGLGAAGAAHPAARALVERFPRHLRTVRERLDEWAGPSPVGARTALLVGCSYVRHATDAARAVLDVARALLPAPHRVVRSCCGLPLLLAGERRGFVEAAHRLCAELTGIDRVVVADPGCARTLLEELPRVGLRPPPVSLLLDDIAVALRRLPAGRLEGLELRYHDACQLARPLDRAALPRAILEHLTGKPPAELARHGRQCECAGAGGLLPLTYPELSRAMADARIAEHRVAGGGLLVCSCGGSLHRLRTRGAEALDLMSLVARALNLGRAEDDGRAR